MFLNGVNLFRPLGKVVDKIAAAGEETVQQYTRWLASERRGDVRVKWIFIQCGINNILHGSYTAAQIIAQMSTLIADIQATTPWATIFLAKMDPAKSKLDAVSLTGGPNRYQQWVDVNAGYASSFPTLWSTSISDALNDGADSLQSTYDSGDGLHPNSSGDVVAANDTASKAAALPGGW